MKDTHDSNINMQFEHTHTQQDKIDSYKNNVACKSISVGGKNQTYARTKRSNKAKQSKKQTKPTKKNTHKNTAQQQQKHNTTQHNTTQVFNDLN